ncbi:glutathione S-transferase family protein [Mycoplana sp. MJR14]|uniref:glutathione S-transferase family protein n=1 Tax=Mycoplana sp. MJR14 TaxID=3032583 RepID=UPI000DDB75E6|nr:glutathione S-transferase family protein [Mycoplana sp. MJR14]MDF1631758.1 glutathione S-transferase family protein [Mycoplana sp. MJR14]
MTLKLYALCGEDRSRPFSPHVWKTMLSLAHKGLSCEVEKVGFTEIPKLEGGFSRTVPLLRDGERLVRDSFDIALYLDEAYPGRPTLFGGDGGRAMARFVEGWSQTTLHPAVMRIALVDIHDMLGPEDQSYFRTSREDRLGQPLEAVVAARDDEIAAFAGKLEPLRTMLKSQPFIGGEGPLFADYIVFGALQWLRVTSTAKVLADDDPVALWFGRVLDLHDGLGRSVRAA